MTRIDQAALEQAAFAAREEGIEDAADRLEAAEVKEKLLHRAARITDGIGPDVRPARERRELLRRRRRLALVLQPAHFFRAGQRLRALALPLRLPRGRGGRRR